jgi:excinuclease UvrABC nuclease subunit
MKRGAFVYRMFGTDGKLLYVGMTGNLLRRFKQHEQSTPWMAEVCYCSAEKFRFRTVAVQAEQWAIFDENPKYNIAHQFRPNRAEAIKARRLLAGIED